MGKPPLSESQVELQIEPQFPLVSALFITWKRFDLLKLTVESFLRNTDYPNLELIIADDGSEPQTQALIRTLPAHKFSLPEKHRGLGANNNNGLKLCAGKYILMIQDDWLCSGPAEYLANAVAVLEANPQVGIINFAGAPHPPDPNQQLKGSSEPCFITPRPYRDEDGKKEYFLYCDQPHIRSRAAFEHVGLYFEDRDMEQCEIDYNHRWKQQTEFLTAVFPAYFMRVFSNEGAAQGRSHRLNKFRYRVQRPFVPAAHWLREHCQPVYRSGRWILNTCIRTLEKLRLVR
jgi:glycosyltransferase involved in cell wall biosynthesis